MVVKIYFKSGKYEVIDKVNYIEEHSKDDYISIWYDKKQDCDIYLKKVIATINVTM